MTILVGFMTCLAVNIERTGKPMNLAKYLQPIRLHIFVSLLSVCVALQARAELDMAQKHSIAERIYQNETGGNPDLLISWNTGENFLSLGIGHFIWFPKDLESPFTETFPALLQFFEAKNVALPEWLKNFRDCPWHSQAEFIQAKNTKAYAELRALIDNTFALQLEFILQRKRAALAKILAEVSDLEQKTLVRDRFSRLANTEKGLYALVDYVNFKGEGVAETERYKGQGWGLLQVLQNMQYPQLDLHQSFTQACIEVLSLRVENSPQKQLEQKWLAGWKKRCQSYS